MFTFRQNASFPRVEAPSTSLVWRYMKSITPSPPSLKEWYILMAAKEGSPQAQEPRLWRPMARCMCAVHLESHVTTRLSYWAYCWDPTLPPTTQ